MMIELFLFFFDPYSLGRRFGSRKERGNGRVWMQYEGMKKERKNVLGSNLFGERDGSK